MDLPTTNAPFIVKLVGLLNKLSSYIISPSLTHGKGSNQSPQTLIHAAKHAPQTGLPDSQNGAPDRVLHEAYQITIVKFLHTVQRKPKLGLDFEDLFHAENYTTMRVDVHLLFWQAFRLGGRIFWGRIVWNLEAPWSIFFDENSLWDSRSTQNKLKPLNCGNIMFFLIFFGTKSCFALLIQPYFACILWKSCVFFFM